MSSTRPPRTEAIDAGAGPLAGATELYRLHYASLVRMAALMTDSRPLAEEIVQDAFAELIARWSVVQPATALGYLRKSVANRARSALRRRRTARNFRPPHRSAAAAADESVLQAAGFELLLRAVGSLPIRQRQVLRAALLQRGVDRRNRCCPGYQRGSCHHIHPSRAARAGSVER